MRKIRLVVVGKTQEKYFQAAEADYLKRIRR
ncbi:23S rRNA (pseudouridine(1915)-N(3))-methyltransferase RlmH [bacterium]|nr:23S rRNA (pseudouridine(1915)-N(3))-methyltransferase RlmH [bacterium]